MTDISAAWTTVLAQGLINPCGVDHPLRRVLEVGTACTYAEGTHNRLKRISEGYQRFVQAVQANPALSTALVATPTLLVAMYSVYKRNPEWFERHNRLNHMPAVSKAEFRRTMQELDAVRANARNANARDDGQRPRPRPPRGKRAGSGRQSRKT